MDNVFTNRGITADDIGGCIPYNNYEMQLVSVYGNGRDEFPIAKIKVTYRSGNVAYHLAGIDLIDENDNYITFDFLDISTEEDLEKYIQQMTDICTVGKNPQIVQCTSTYSEDCDFEDDISEFFDVLDIDMPAGLSRAKVENKLYDLTKWVSARINYKNFCEHHLTDPITRLSRSEFNETIQANRYPLIRNDWTGCIDEVYIEKIGKRSLPIFIIRDDTPSWDVLAVGPMIDGKELTFDYLNIDSPYMYATYVDDLKARMRRMTIRKSSDDFGLSELLKKYNIMYNVDEVNRILADIK